ncbi:Phosphatidylinositol mannoside acyltransferase [Pseudoruegeria aquimaris]|uniref:Phosphatidylinositol mannoside acyltransferase n=1 Tax=Pseudoruegeria aquimaris TaxID=393663 RepID=A0A1Y5SIY8_9RHOB|nr:lysophospholipid acyltransferase family protein [Pseudoruegeria aquimaris]SLN41906.1 Phosphatidylinositol mannoside acyltransferase [Pseudoruegeria aquimaris]
MARKRNDLADRIVDLVARGIIGAARLLPYRARVQTVGWLTAHVIGPLAGFPKRVRANLAYVGLDLPEAEIRRLCREVSRNVGRNLIEMYSTEEFKAHAARTPVEGPGTEVLFAARDAGRPVVIVTAHFGSYDAARAAVVARGCRIGGIYKPMSNPHFNAHYVDALSAIAKPMFPRGRKGLAEMLKFLKGGGMVGLLIDQDISSGATLSFFGKPARTPLSAAEMALRYDAPMIPIFGIRKENGVDFRLEVQAPIPPGSPEEMTQAFNDRLETLVRENMDQWFWIHRRWEALKPRPKKKAPATTPPAETPPAETPPAPDRS